MPQFDAYAAEFVDDPYLTYRTLRARSPVFFDDHWGMTFFARHADVSAILRDRRFGRDVRHAVPEEDIDAEVFARIYPSQYPTWTRLIRDSFIDLEPPRHTRVRRLVQGAFGRRASESYRPRLEDAAEENLRRVVPSGSMEAIADYATPIPLAMISEMMGVPAADQPQLVDWSHAIVRLFDADCSPDEGAEAEDAVKAFAEYCEDLLDLRRSDPQDDLVTALVQAEVEGDVLTDEELVATCILTLNAGHEATVQAIGNALLALARNPEAYQRWRRDPTLETTAIDELLRFDTPLQMFERWVLEDMDWNGTELRRGSKVGLLFGAANRDELVFEDAEMLDLSRTENPHISFGAGVHYCVGAPLAKVEMEAALTRFLAHVAEFELANDDLPRVPSLVFRGVQRLDLRLDPAET